MDSLLSNLHTRIRGSTEDIATLGLLYILEKSSAARREFTNTLYAVCGIKRIPQLYYRSQVTGKNNERPDIAGFDDSNTEILLCEAKFWAGLTKNQPVEYLRRLEKTNTKKDKALVFICPEKRINSLWGELLRLVGYKNGNMQSDGKRIVVNGVILSIISWRTILETLKQTLVFENSLLLNDLYQIEGLCKKMDDEAFIPFTPEDFGVDRARNYLQFYIFVDHLADEVRNQLNASTKKLKATPRYAGYRRYFSLNGYGCAVSFDCELWNTKAETPFWLIINEIKDNKWIFPKRARETLNDWEYVEPKRLYIDEKSGEIQIPLYPKPFSHKDNVLSDMIETIREVFDRISI